MLASASIPKFYHTAVLMLMLAGLAFRFQSMFLRLGLDGNVITAAFAHARDRSGCRICFGEVENSRTSCLEGKSGCGQTFRDGPRPPADSHAPGACYRPGRGMCFHLNSRFELGAGCLVGGCLLLDLDSTLPGVTSVELTGTQEGFSRGGDLRGLAKNFPFSARLGLRPRLADAGCGVSSARRGGRPEQGEAGRSREKCFPRDCQASDPSWTRGEVLKLFQGFTL